MVQGKRYYISITLIVLIFSVTISCISLNKLKYFNDIDSLAEPVSNPREQKKIMPFDYLYIKVLSTDEQTARIFNFSDDVSGNMPLSLAGFPVDENGNINFPFIGYINLEGLTTDQAATKLKAALSQYISNASIVVRFMDNKVSIIGEVQRPGSFTFGQDKLTIYEAISLGGGLSQYGDRKKVVLIRKINDKVMLYKIDLSNSKITSKDYYYIVSNDVIVVEPMKAITRRYNMENFQAVVTTITAFLTLYLLFYLNPRP